MTTALRHLDLTQVDGCRQLGETEVEADLARPVGS
jgi:hypothetical protein